MEESLIENQVVLPANDQATEGSKPGESPLNLPPSSIAAQLPAVLRRRLDSAASVWRNQLDSSSLQPLSQWIAVIRFVPDEPVRLLLRPTRSRPRNADRRKCGFNKLDFGWGSRLQVDSKRKTLTVDQYHPLCALPPLSLSDRRPPFFAGEKLASMNASLQSSWDLSSRVDRKALQMQSQISSSSCRFNLLQQVEGEGNLCGKSFQRAPVRKIHRIPSNTDRESAQDRPPLRLCGNLGSRGEIFSHFASVSIRPTLAIGITSYLQNISTLGQLKPLLRL